MPTSNMRPLCWRARRLTDKRMMYGQYTEFGSEGYIYSDKQERDAVDITTKGQLLAITDQDGQDVYEGDLIINDDGRNKDIYIVVHRGVCFVGKHYKEETYITLVTHQIKVVGMYYSTDLEQELIKIQAIITNLAGKTDANKNIKY